MGGGVDVMGVAVVSAWTFWRIFPRTLPPAWVALSAYCVTTSVRKSPSVRSSAACVDFP